MLSVSKWRPALCLSSVNAKKLLTFSFSVPTSFLSSLFFSLPGASAVGMEEWKMKSFPLHSAAWREENDDGERKDLKKKDRTKVCSVLLPDMLFIVSQQSHEVMR